ncbi:hypothetical protein PR202_ga06088 [Eleusine coracana subsp. coracana]|uniref:Uncharacterized protein n=1 Tax=Eleusine coracana subsp. coracana TaxID=191504 RepID=A0AAV5BTX9_ELECO|nr:hypothetical protein PR202_ga06088 [Eleusine coracana subsp. coracana]
MEAPLLLPVSSIAGSSSSIISIIDDSIVDEAVASSSPPGKNEESSSPSTQSIVFRVVAVLVVACASLLAQHEASKGFAIDVVNGGAGSRDTAAGRRFHLHFVSNGRAERILHRASRAVERALFPDASFPRKRVTRVTVTMAGHNLTAADDDVATVDAVRAGGEEEYVITLSPGLLMMSSTDMNKAVAAAVRRAVARMLLWDGRGAAPARVTEAMVDYLASSSSGDDDDDDMMVTWRQENKEEEECMSARFLRHLEQRRGGFVARSEPRDEGPMERRRRRRRARRAGAASLRGLPRRGGEEDDGDGCC